MGCALDNFNRYLTVPLASTRNSPFISHCSRALIVSRTTHSILFLLLPFFLYSSWANPSGSRNHTTSYFVGVASLASCNDPYGVLASGASSARRRRDRNGTETGYTHTHARTHTQQGTLGCKEEGWLVDLASLFTPSPYSVLGAVLARERGEEKKREERGRV